MTERKQTDGTLRQRMDSAVESLLADTEANLRTLAEIERIPDAAPAEESALEAVEIRI